MPLNAIAAGVVDYELRADQIGALLAKLADGEVENSVMERDRGMELENRIAMGKRFSTSFEPDDIGPPSGYICPDCNGSLQQVDEHNYRCQVGHAWTAEALLRARDEEVEQALWVAFRSLQEKSRLARRLADNVGSGVLHEKYSLLAREAEHAVSVLSQRFSEAYNHAGEPGAG